MNSNNLRNRRGNSTAQVRAQLPPIATPKEKKADNEPIPQSSWSIRTVGTIICFFIFGSIGGMIGMIAAGTVWGMAYGFGIGGVVGAMFGNIECRGFDDTYDHHCQGFAPKRYP
jgi:predicted lipid-binding transport protein (Tim44 family)